MKVKAVVAGLVGLVLVGAAGAQALPDGLLDQGPQPRLGYHLHLSSADESQQSLATQLSNPVSSLISVPFQLNWNQGMGTGDGTQTLLNIQPVIPISISENWNLISRTILPLVSLSDMTPEFGTENG